MHVLSSGDHKRASEWVDVQSHAAMDKKCSTSPFEGSRPSCCSKKGLENKMAPIRRNIEGTPFVPGWHYEPRI